MNVIFLSPQYPPEMTHYCRGLRQVGAHVFGVGDAPVQALAPQLKEHLDDYLQVPGILDEDDVMKRVAACVMTTRTDAPTSFRRRASSAALYAAIPPVIPRMTFLPLKPDKGEV